jgi:DNA-binding response OmpR family regulator
MGALRVLVADARPEICEVLEYYLRGKDFSVTCAHHSAGARRILVQERIAIAIIDMVIPGDGGEALAEVAQSRGVPVILMSGEPNSMAKMPALPHAYLRKPFHLVDLEKVMKSIFRDLEGAMKTILRADEQGPNAA